MIEFEISHGLFARSSGDFSIPDEIIKTAFGRFHDYHIFTTDCGTRTRVRTAVGVNELAHTPTLLPISRLSLVNYQPVNTNHHHEQQHPELARWRRVWYGGWVRSRRLPDSGVGRW